MALDAAGAIDNAHAWFEGHSGWAPPDPQTLAEWIADGVCRCPDECLVAPDGWCEHGLASWKLILDTVDDRGRAGRPATTSPTSAAAAAHRHAVAAGQAGYTDPISGLYVMTARYLLDRGYCCDEGCRHCPYGRPGNVRP